MVLLLASLAFTTPLLLLHDTSCLAFLRLLLCET
jgi:hypothetical protein